MAGPFIHHNPPQGAACWEGCHFIGNPSIDERASPFSRRILFLPEAAAFVCGAGYHELYVNG
ncbi:MAG: hypothetical protein LBF77_02945, partial [Spirochaetaceae bacterium]|nr:hypothetical protein [Spirochaetaceae bacterium]